MTGKMGRRGRSLNPPKQGIGDTPLNIFLNSIYLKECHLFPAMGDLKNVPFSPVTYSLF